MNTLRPQSIFIQIAERIRDSILIGEYPINGRIPSVREMAELMEVNPNTVARSYERLQQKGIIYTQRGIGYYVSQEAYEIIYKEKQESFFQSMLPKVFGQMKLLNIELSDLEDAWKEFLESAHQISPTSYPIEE